VTRLVFFNDPHVSRHAPSCRADSYHHEVLDKLHECARIATKLGAAAIGCSGDWFHRKGKVTFAEANDLLAVLRGWRAKGLDVIGILGNHDIAGHSLDSLDNRAVGTLVHSQVLHLLDHAPWTSPEGNVVVTGTSYAHGGDADDEARARTYSVGLESEWEPPQGMQWVHVAHGTLVKREFFDDYTRMEDLVALLDQHGILPDVIVCGHLHYSEGIVEVPRPSDPGRIVRLCRLGSLGRVSSDDLDRQPQALVLAFKGSRCVAKAVPIGKPPLGRQDDVESDPEREDYEERIQDFVRVLREESDDWSMVDHQVLLRRLAVETEQPEAVVEAAIRAVERRQ